MPRISRQPSQTGFYHVLTRGNNRSRVFHDQIDFRDFLEILSRYKQKMRWSLHHFCLMPNHVHLLIHLPEFHLLGKLMQGVNQSYERYYRKRYGHTGHLWQGRYKSIPIEEETYLLECARYIERNPVRAGMVEKPEAYPWSSYAIFAEGKPSRLVEPDPGYLSLGSTPEKRSQAYRNYLQVTRPYEELLDKGLKIQHAL